MDQSVQALQQLTRYKGWIVLSSGQKVCDQDRAEEFVRADELEAVLAALPNQTPIDVSGLAVRIANALFTDGTGVKASRLALKTFNDADLGGWGFDPATRQIERVLRDLAALPLVGGPPAVHCTLPAVHYWQGDPDPNQRCLCGVKTWAQREGLSSTGYKTLHAFVEGPAPSVYGRETDATHFVGGPARPAGGTQT